MLGAVATGVALAGGVIYLFHPPPVAVPLGGAPREAAEPPAGDGAAADSRDPVALSRDRRQRCSCVFDAAVLITIAGGVVWVLRRDAGFDGALAGALAAARHAFQTEAEVLKRLFF